MIGDILPRERASSVTMWVERNPLLYLFRIRNLTTKEQVGRSEGKTVGKGADSELSRELKEVMA